MTMIAFTRNYTDRSNNTGYQFEFHCDRCGNGFMSTFHTSKLGVSAEFMRAAGSLFGGVFGNAAAAGDHVKDALRGPAWDKAYAGAVTEGKTHFQQCSRCAKWVCPEKCFNMKRRQCVDCSPDLTEEAAAAQAQAAKDQVWEKARLSDQTGGMDMTTEKVASCPHCGAKASGGKFCGECGKPMAAKGQCGKCHAKLEPNAKFCPECGEKAG